MTGRLVRLVYRSQSTEGIAADLATILEVSRRRNAEAGVTGALLHHDGHFGQVLEGECAAVEGTFDRLVGDPRHRAVMILDLQPIDERRFATWSMTCIGQHLADRAAVERAVATMAFTMADASGRGIVDLLSHVLRDRGAETPAAG